MYFLPAPYFPLSNELVSKWVKLLSRVRLFVTPWTVAHQAPPSMEFSRQEYWSGLPFPSLGNLPNPGIKPHKWYENLQFLSTGEELSIITSSLEYVFFFLRFNNFISIFFLDYHAIQAFYFLESILIISSLPRKPSISKLLCSSCSHDWFLIC